MSTEPQAESSRLWGRRRKPCWAPSCAKSTVATTGEGGRSVWAVIGCSILDEESPRHVCQRLHPRLGDHDALGDLDSPVIEPQTRHEVEGHARRNSLRSPGRRLIVRSPQSGG